MTTTSDLLPLRVLAAVAEAGSMRRAALGLGLSPSALSQALRRLEAQLGVALLNRSTRSLALTAAGEALLARAMPALRQLDAAMAEASDQGGRVAGSLRLSVPRSAARLLLAPLLARYCERHPQVQLELVTQDELVDIVEQGFDAGVRFAERLPQDMVAVPLSPPQRFIVVATPRLADAGPREPADLARLPCIRQRFASGALFHWDFRHEDGREQQVEPRGPLTVDDQAVALAAALQGLGFAFVYEVSAREPLADGRLVQVLGDWCPPGTGLALYYPGRRQTSPALRALLTLLAEATPPGPR